MSHDWVFDWAQRLLARARPGRDGRDGADGVDGKEGTPGPRGDRGPQGPQGPQGEPGTDGRDGADGAPGAGGAEGKRGPRGPKGDTGPAPAHEWDGTKLRFQHPDGSWGKKVDLEGPRGPRGYGGGGGSINFDVLPVGDGSTPTEIILKQHGIWVRTPWATFLTLVGTTPTYTPGLDFSDARNSQYIGAVHL